MRRSRIAASIAAIGLLLGACSASGGQETSKIPTNGGTGSTTGPDQPPTSGSTTPEPGTPSISWKDCGGGFQCGTLAVPIDYSKPKGPTIRIAVTRHPAKDPANRIGVLMMNPGGPGGSAIDLARSFPRSGPIGDHFDIVGFDPRGVGESSALDCHSHLQEIYDADPTIDSAADRAETLATSKAFVAECQRKYGDLLPFLGTTDVARDMDQVRKALGERQVNYLGFSYGTSLGQEYARLFPTHVRAMVIDGVVDHAPDGIETARQQAAGFTTALDSYSKHCDTEGCGFGSRKALAVIDQVTAAAEKRPIPAASADRPAGPGVVSLALAQALYSDQLWSALSRGLRDALDGDGSELVALADEYLGRQDDGTYDGGFEIYFAVSCLDDTWPSNPDEVIADAADAEKDTPRFGSAIVIDYIRCSLWPARSKPLEPVPASTKGLPPIVVVSTTHDPATPYENGVHVAKQIPGAVLVTNEGEGHTVVANGKPCIDDMVAAYFVDLDVPKDGLTCR